MDVLYIPFVSSQHTKMNLEQRLRVYLKNEYLSI